MFPSKSMVEYMSEMSRLFARPGDEILQENPYNISSQSPFNSTITNASSSSTDSTSPESCPEGTVYHYSPPIRPISEPQPLMFESPRPNQGRRPDYDTPKASETSHMVRRQRPIVGRKIFSEQTTQNFERVQRTPPQSQTESFGLKPVWQDDVPFQQSSPINYTPHYYELFPPGSKFEARTSVNTSPTSSAMSNVSPSQSISPKSVSRSPAGPLVMYQRSQTPNPNIWPSTSRAFDISPSKMCTFCKKNGETPIVYMTHYVKEKVGDNKYIASCPILRSHICSICGATGDDAHTITYCPVLRNNNNGQPLKSTTITLKNTRVKSNGRRRF